MVALARPRSAEQNTTASSEGIDIVMALDISGSMLARDFKPDRMGAAKQMAGEFVTARAGDRIGLVVFAGESFTQSPLTTDYATLQTLLSRVKSGLIEDGTAIGNGLATGINRLRESDAKSKVIILLTDGVNNRGQIAPLTAAEIAREQGIRVYTIGVGSRGEAPYPALDMFGNMTFVRQRVEIDEDTLREIASMTGGRYFRATDNAALRAIYAEINQLEKSRVEVSQFTTYTEEFPSLGAGRRAGPAARIFVPYAFAQTTALMFRFANPVCLWLLTLIPVMIVLFAAAAAVRRSPSAGALR